MHIRLAVAADYPALTTLHNAVFPMLDWVAADFAHADAQQTTDAKGFGRRWVAEIDGQVVGMAQHSRDVWVDDPHKYLVGVAVHPAYQGQGIGTRLYEHLLAELRPHAPRELVGQVWEGHTAGSRFAEKLGYRATLRKNTSQLDLTRFDPSHHADALTHIAAQNIMLKSVSALRAENPNAVQALFAMDIALFADVPSDEPFIAPDLATWCAYELDDPLHYPDLWLIAVHAGQYVGESSVWGNHAGTLLQTGLTAVHRDYRRRGIARALKVAVLTRAQEQGYQVVKTNNEQNNQGMLAINAALGFVPQPAWISYRHTIAL